ncbi:hypothetical protein SK128_002282, partial [Halocaridina rubra]
IMDVLMKIAFICKHDCFETRVFLFPNHPKKANTLFMTKNKKSREYNISSHLLANVVECLRTRLEEPTKANNSTRILRGSRKRRLEYHSNVEEDTKMNFKELETTMSDIVNEKMDDVMECYGVLNKRIEALEANLEKIVHLLTKSTEETLPTSVAPLQEYQEQMESLESAA